MGLAQQPIHRRLRAQVAALIEQDRVHLTWREVDKAVLMENVEDLGSLGRRGTRGCGFGSRCGRAGGGLLRCQR